MLNVYSAFATWPARSALLNLCVHQSIEPKPLNAFAIIFSYNSSIIESFAGTFNKPGSYKLSLKAQDYLEQPFRATKTPLQDSRRYSSREESTRSMTLCTT
jgi:hypothetical protein